MIILDREGSLVVYLKSLCTLTLFQTLLDAVSISHAIQFEEVLIEDGIIELEFEWKNSLLVIQYDPFLGISMYVGCLNDATDIDIESLKEIAAIFDKQLTAIDI